jgi:bifunctional DNA-binding transcriptional regulator/antitoxin component of YhaV-PrlF toxin-antitoxin module
MTTSLSSKRQVLLPKELCDRKKIKPGMILHLTEVGDGFFVRPAKPPTVEELKAVFEAVDRGVSGRQSVAEEHMVADEIKKYRAEKRRRRK